MKSLTRVDVERLAIAGTHRDSLSADNMFMNYLNPATGATESWYVRSLPIAYLHTKIRIFVRYVGTNTKLAGMEGKTDGQEDKFGFVLVRWGTPLRGRTPQPDRERIHVAALKEIRKFTKNFV